MTKDEFEILYALYKSRKMNSNDRSIWEYDGIELEKCKNIIIKLIDHGMVAGKNNRYEITEKGIISLQPYKVRNAIILAAGMSTRFVPFSFEKPKGLMECRGQRLIEREIEQIKEAGINEIIIVVGYKKEQYYYLAEKYGAIIIDNPEFATRNSNGSIWAARNYIGNSYICASDNYFLYNEFQSYEYRDFYDVIYGEGELDERGVFIDKNDQIYKTERPTKDRWIMFGKSYWSFEFTKKFLSIIEQGYADPILKEYLWEWIWNLHIDEIPFYIKRHEKDTILEFDSLDDLREYDSYYIENSGIDIISDICDAFSCKPADITEIKLVKNDDIGKPFSFCFNGDKYIVRHSLVNPINKYTQEEDAVINREKGWEIRKIEH